MPASSGTATVELGTLEGSERRSAVPGDFGDAVSLVVTMAFAERGMVNPPVPAATTPGLNWQLLDSISGEWWSPIEDTLGRLTRHQTTEGATARFVVPFGPRLEIVAWPGYASNRMDTQQHGVIRGVIAEVFWLKL